MIDAIRAHRILALSLPIIGGMISQNLLNLVDTAMVGTLGDNALAAVGIGSVLAFMSQAFIMGLSSGVQAIAARRFGEGRRDETAYPLNGGLLLAVALSIPWSMLLFWLAPYLFGLLIDDPAVIELGVPYYRARVVAVVAVGCNFAFRGFWNGINMSRVYMRTLVFMHIANVAISYCLIFGALGLPKLGVLGAGIGTAASTFLGTGYYLMLGRERARAQGFLHHWPRSNTLRGVMRLSVPNGIQQFFFAAGLTALFWIVGKVGTAELAAAHVLINIMLVAILPCVGFGIAATSLVGQSLGQGKPEDARRWGWDVVQVTIATVFVIAIPMVAIPKLLLSVFIHDMNTVEIARAPLQLVGLVMPIDAIGMVLLNALLGAGDNRRVMAVSVGMQWGLFLPVAYWIGPVLGWGLLGIWAAQVGYRALQTGVMSALWAGGKWAEIKL